VNGACSGLRPKAVFDVSGMNLWSLLPELVNVYREIRDEIFKLYSIGHMFQETEDISRSP